MNDELKNKSGKVKVMYVRSDDDSDKRTHNPRTGKGGAAQQSLALTVDVAPPVMSEIIRAVTVNMKLRHGVPYPARREMRRRKKSITAVSVVKVLSILKFCVASVRRRRASTAKMPARRYSRAVLTPLCAHGLSKA